MKFWNFFRSAEAIEVVADVKLAEFGDEGDIHIELHEPEELLPQARIRLTRKQAIALCASILALTSGCTSVGGMCHDARITMEYAHTSHPMAGRPFESQYGSEDTLDTIGPNLHCQSGRIYVETGLGYKIYHNGFEGPNLTGSLRVGMTLWEM